MLKIIKTMGELNIEQLIAVYEERIRETAEQHSVDIWQAENAFLDYLETDFFRQKGAFYALWVVTDTYQSALRLEPYRDGLLLQALETAPNARRRGYAHALTTDVLQYLRDEGCNAVYSHVEKRNAPSLRVHFKCGFREISDHATYLDGTVTQNSYTLCCYL